MKEKIKSYDFWMAVASALMLVLQAVGFTREIPYLQELTTAFLGFLAVSGFIVKPPGKQTETDPGIGVNDKNTASDSAGEFADIIDKIIDNTKK